MQVLQYFMHLPLMRCYLMVTTFWRFIGNGCTALQAVLFDIKLVNFCIHVYPIRYIPLLLIHEKKFISLNVEAIYLLDDVCIRKKHFGDLHVTS